MGCALAHEAASQGATVDLIIGPSNEVIFHPLINRIDIQTADEINTDIGKEVAFPIPANISDDSQLKNLVNETIKKIGKIDVLVCNAATNPFMGSMLDMPIEKFDKVEATINTNYTAYVSILNIITVIQINTNIAF